MSDLPPWYSIGAIGLATSVGAGFAALWHGLWPGGAPSLAGFVALCLLLAVFGVSDTFRAVTRSPMDPGLALAQIVLGGAALWVLTQRLLGFAIGAAFLAVLRLQVGSLTVHIVDLYDRGDLSYARRVRRRFSGLVLLSGMALVLCGLGSNLETSTALPDWGFGPIAVVALTCGLMLIAGAEFEVMHARFRGGGVTADAGFGSGWWGPVAGLIAAVVIVSAVVPPMPSAITLQQVGAQVLAVAQATTTNSGPQNLPSAPSTPKHKASNKIGPIPKDKIGLYMFLLLAAIFVGVEIVRSLQVMRRLGLGAAGLAREYARRASVLGSQAFAFFRGIYTLVRQGLLEGDWRALARLLRRWWAQFLDVFSTFRRRNLWRQLIRRSSEHAPGAEYAAPAGPRTAAGAAWRLPPGDPRRRVREVYREFIIRAAAVGLGRQPGQSPASYRVSVSAAEPGAGGGLQPLTTSYEWARFSPHEVTTAHVDGAVRGWETVAAALSRWREVADGRPPAGRAGRGRGGRGRGARGEAAAERSGRRVDWVDEAGGNARPGRERHVEVRKRPPLG